MSDTIAPPVIQPASLSYRRVALSILLLIYTLNFLDRQIVNILAEAIKRDLGLSDGELGALTGIAFALLYTILGIPIARYAERGNRPFIIATATVVWSGFTMLCGFAGNFFQLLIARVGVGVGEAGCTPPAHSLISDYTPREKRASALAFYHLGTPLGSLIGVILGGFIGGYYGWRVAFMVAGAPGILAALIAVFFLREPRRTLTDEQIARTPVAPTLAQAFAELRSKRTFWFISLAAAIVAFNGYGAAAFGAPFYLRVHGPEIAALAAQAGLPPLAFLGLVTGVIGGTAGLFGTWLGGVMADRMSRKDARAHMTIPAVAGMISVPVYCAGLFLPSFWPTVAVLAVPTLLSTLWYGPVYGTVQGLVRPQTRATAAAVLLFIINLIGLGLGPLFVGLLSDALRSAGFSEAEGVRWSLFIFALLGSSCILFFWMARSSIRKDLTS